jgi:predicted aspartyl protease
MSHTYDATFPWPFPRLPVVVCQVEGDAATATLDALIDTGADVTLVPVEHPQAVQADEIYTARLSGHWQQRRPVAVHLVDLEIDGQRLPAVEAIADEQGDRILLGRNALSKLIVLLDGPDSQTDVLAKRPRLT